MLQDMLHGIMHLKAKPSTNSILDSPEAELLAEEYDMALRQAPLSEAFQPQIRQVMIMVFRNRGMALRPIHRIKHVIDSQFGLVAGTSQTLTVVLSKDAPVIANTNEVETGSKVYGIYCHVEAYATNDSALANLYMAVMKNPGSALTLPDPNVVGASVLKKYFIHQEMVMLQKNQEVGAAELGGNPRTVFNGVVKIPKGYARNGPNDAIQIRFLTPGVTADVCVQCHYKEFR